VHAEEGFDWVVLGQNPPEIAYWERGANPQTHHGQRQHRPRLIGAIRLA
jgi:hypothetical protein